MSAAYAGFAENPVTRPFNTHQDIIILCKKPKKRITPTLHRCTYPNCNIKITGRNWRNRKPENQLELCDHHIRQRISVIREGLKR